MVCMFKPEDESALSEAEDEEIAILAKAGRQAGPFRLACQARLDSNLVANVRRVRPAQPGDRLPFA